MVSAAGAEGLWECIVRGWRRMQYSISAYFIALNKHAAPGVKYYGEDGLKAPVCRIGDVYDEGKVVE